MSATGLIQGPFMLLWIQKANACPSALHRILQNAGVPGLTQEASDVLIWCLTQEPYCYKEWDNLYPRNIQASSAILKKISDECKEQPTKYTADLDKLMVMLNRFRKKNKEALTRKEYADSMGE